MNRQLAISIVFILAGFAGVYGINSFIEQNRISLPDEYADSDLDLQGGKLKGFALGGEGLLADWYWMRSLQYIGDKVVRRGLESINLDDLSELNPRLLYPILDNATTLDPELMAAYSFGATVLPAIDPQQAIRLTEKGIRNNPENWRLYQYLGYIHWRLKDYEKAAEVYESGSRVAGAPNFFRLMAARMKTQSGSRATAREIYSQLFAEAPNEQTRKSAELRLAELDSLDERDAINSALAKFRAERGRCATDWREIITMLADVQLPGGRDFRVDGQRNLVDPTGAPYRLNTQKCEAEIDRSKSKIPVT